MTRLVAALAALGIAGGIATSPVAAADPDDLVPYCSGNQTPMDSNCRVAPLQVSANDSNLGTNPDVPLGTGSGDPLVIGQSPSHSSAG